MLVNLVNFNGFRSGSLFSSQTKKAKIWPLKAMVIFFISFAFCLVFANFAYDRQACADDSVPI